MSLPYREYEDKEERKEEPVLLSQLTGEGKKPDKTTAKNSGPLPIISFAVEVPRASSYLIGHYKQRHAKSLTPRLSL